MTDGAVVPRRLLQRLQQRTAALVAHPATFFGLSSANVTFDGVEFSDATERFLRHRGLVRDVQIVEFPTHVGRTGTGVSSACSFSALIA